MHICTVETGHRAVGTAFSYFLSFGADSSSADLFDCPPGHVKAPIVWFIRGKSVTRMAK